MRIGNGSISTKNLILVLLFIVGTITVQPAIAMAASNSVEKAVFLPEPPPTPYELRETPYSVVLFGTPDDPNKVRELLQTIKDMGATKTQSLTYWWKLETLGGEYWEEMGYSPNASFGEAAMRNLDTYIEVSHELGIKPCLRMGTFRVNKGLYHPMDKTGSVQNYADWLGRLAKRYRGKVDHYVIGDEENKNFPAWNWVGTPENYIKMFIPIAKAIKEGDPDTQVSSTSVSSAPATDWVLELIDLGLPKYADGVAGNYSNYVIENLMEIEELVTKVRKVWPEAKFYANGAGYADSMGIHDMRQAGIVAQCYFTLWDINWNSAPYYTYTYSWTADTHQNFGLMKPATANEPAVFSDAWKAYQTIAQTFYNRTEMKEPDFEISLRQAEIFTASDGTTIRLAPPDPVFKTYIRADGQLLIYLAYRKFREPREGRWDIILKTRKWGKPQRIPLLDYKGRIDLPHRWEDGNLVIENIKVGLQPQIITLRKVKK